MSNEFGKFIPNQISYNESDKNNRPKSKDFGGKQLRKYALGIPPTDIR